MVDVNKNIFVKIIKWGEKNIRSKKQVAPFTFRLPTYFDLTCACY
jgi:hypothetical protein